LSDAPDAPDAALREAIEPGIEAGFEPAVKARLTSCPPGSRTITADALEANSANATSSRPAVPICLQTQLIL
jgi:hypothetical protein